jgi:hypothetical protein
MPVSPMKIPAFTLGAFLAAAATAAEPPLLKFPEAKIEVPALSLLEGAKQRVPLLPKETDACFRVMLPSQREHSRLVSKMPILVPGPSSSKMIVKVPDDSIAYKLLIKKPEVESVK